MLHLSAASYWSGFGSVYSQLEGLPGMVPSSGFTSVPPTPFSAGLCYYCTFMMPMVRNLIWMCPNAVALLALACAPEGSAIELFGFNWSRRQARNIAVVDEEVS